MQYVYETDVKTAMRDGVKLNATVWRPVEGKLPTLLVRLPYGKDVMPMILGDMGWIPPVTRFLRAGYAIVIQDARGTYGSEGVFSAKVHEPSDGRDTIEWIISQDWSNGVVGGYGGSYSGMAQWAAASEGHPALKAITPLIAAMNWYDGLWYSPGGAMALNLVNTWHATMYLADEQRELQAGRGDEKRAGALAGFLGAGRSAHNVTPVVENPVFKSGRWLNDILAHPDYDEFWQSQDLTAKIPKMTAPPLCIAGWYDLFANSGVKDFVSFRAGAATAEARDGARLLIGPWDHNNTSGQYRDRDFGPMANAAASDLPGYHLRHFDRWLRDNLEANSGDARVRIFVMGLDQWRDEEEWPLPDTQYVDYYLGGEVPANTARGAGTLAQAAPQTHRSDTIFYDPARPVPTTGGGFLPYDFDSLGPVDQARVASREDVLCFATPVLEQDIEVTGFIRLNLFVSSSAVDTDFTAKLVDVFPDGRAINLCDGILRMRYREGVLAPKLMTPETIYEVEIDVSVTSNVFRAGHRIRVDVSSSNFPKYDRNSNTGGFIAHEAEKDMVPALNKVHHGPQHPSRLTLPIIKRAAKADA